MFCLPLINEPPFVHLAVDLAYQLWWLDWLSIIVGAWGTKLVSARSALQVSMFELGPVLSCYHLLAM